MMRLSCSIVGLRTLLGNLLPAVRAASGEAVELAYAQIERDLAGARDQAAALHTLLDENGLELSGLEASPLAAAGDDDRADNVVTIRQQMIFAHDMGLDAVSIRTGPRRTQDLLALRTGLAQVLERAEALGLDVNLANAYGTSIEQLDDLNLLLAGLEHPRLRWLLDTGQFHEAAVNPRAALRAFGDRMGMLRIGDRIGRRPVPLGEGELNVPAVVEHARRIGYRGWVVLEPPPGAIADRHEYWRTGLQYLRGLDAG